MSGKLVTVQAWTSRGWLTFGNARARSKDGKWSYRYTFTGTTTTSRYRFRALVPQEESYPYVTGTSPVRAVVVRGAVVRAVFGAVAGSRRLRQMSGTAFGRPSVAPLLQL